MLNEFYNLLKKAYLNQQLNIKNILVTVVDLEGSSYRKPGVRMLVSNNNTTVGAISGGCVEQEIVNRAQSVFTTNTAKVISYDGRYRLGCEGILYILLEPIFISDVNFNTLKDSITKRVSINTATFYQKKDGAIGNFGTAITTDNYCINLSNITSQKTIVFKQTLTPIFKLLIIGAQHDAAILCNLAAQIGWRVDVIAPTKGPDNTLDFKRATHVYNTSADIANLDNLDTRTAVIIMTHSFTTDLKYVIKLYAKKLKYIGVIGSKNKREKLFNHLIDNVPDFNDTFLDHIYSPAGLNIGAETPEEIAIAILSEIMSVFNNKKQYFLKDN